MTLQCYWHDRLCQLVQYQNLHGHTAPIDTDLSRWARDQRSTAQRGAPAFYSTGHGLARCVSLDRINFLWSVPRWSWAFGFRQLELHATTGAHLQPLPIHPTQEQQLLLRWCHLQRVHQCAVDVGDQRASRNWLQRRARLIRLGFDWIRPGSTLLAGASSQPALVCSADFSAKAVARLMRRRWKTMFDKLVEYRALYGHTCPICSSPAVDPEFAGLYDWATKMRHRKRMAANHDAQHDTVQWRRQQAALEDVNFLWEVPRWSWQRGMDQLVDYKTTARARAPPARRHSREHQCLQQWCHRQRLRLHLHLTARQARWLDAMNFDWRHGATIFKTDWSIGSENMRVAVQYLASWPLVAMTGAVSASGAPPAPPPAKKKRKR